MPTIAATSDAITEAPGANNGTSDLATGTITFTDVDLTDHPTVTAPFSGYTYFAANGTTPLTLTSAQQTALEFALTLTPNGGNSHDGSVAWSYQVADNALDFLAYNETLVLTYTASVNDGHGGSVSTPIKVTIHGTNDVPTIAATSDAITEAPGTNNGTSDLATGTITFTDVDLTDHPTVTAPFSGYTYFAANGTTALTLSSAQQTALESALTLTPNGGNSHDGSVAWSYQVADNALDFLAANETLVLTYTASVNDGHGGSVATPIKVTVHGTDDAPTIAATNGAITEQAGTNNSTSDQATGSITFTDVDLTDHPTVTAPFSGYTYTAANGTTALTLTSAQESALELALTLTPNGGNGHNGSVAWSYQVADNALDFLADNETLVLTYTASVNDGHGGSVSTPIKVTVHGTNDAPVIASGATAGFDTSGSAGSSTPDELSGSLGFVDPDLADHHTLTFSAPTITTTAASYSSATSTALASAFSASINDSTGSGYGQINWYFSAADSIFDFLGNGQTLTATYNVTIKDGANATSTQSVTITVAGTDQVPVFTSGPATPSITESTTESISNPASITDTRTGTLGFSDRDHGETHTVLVFEQEDGVVWTGGDATALSAQTLNTFSDALTALVQSDSATSGSGTVAWTFSVADNVFDFMSAGQTLTLSYNVYVRDSLFNTSAPPQTVTVTVHGSDKSIVYDTLGNTHATVNSPNLALSISNLDDLTTNALAVWTPAQYHLDTGENYSGSAPLLLVNATSGTVLVELNGIKELDFHLGNRDDTLDVSETAASPVRTVPIVADGGSFDEDGVGNTVVLGDAYAGLPHTAFAAIFGSDHTTVIGVAITHIVGGVEITDKYTNFQNFKGHFSFNSLANELSLAQLAFAPGRADPAHSLLTAVVNFAGPQETALLTLTDRDGNWNTRPGDTVGWAGAGTFSPASNAAATDSHGLLVDTFTPTTNTTQTVTASFDAVTLSTSVHFVAMNIWTNTGGGDWSTASNWSGNVVPASGEAVWIGNAGSYTVNVTASQSIYGLGSMATAALNLTNTLDVTGTGNSVIAGALVTAGSGQLLAEHGTVQLNGAVTNNAVIEAENGATITIAGNVTGAGALVVDGGYLNAAGSVAGTQAITITGAGVAHLSQAAGGHITFLGAGMLALDAVPSSGMTVNNFGLGDSIVLTNLSYSASATLSWNISTNTLTVNNGSTSESIKFGEGHSLSDFALAADPLGSGGTDIVYSHGIYYGGAVSYAAVPNSALLDGVLNGLNKSSFIGGINDAGVAVVNDQNHSYFYVNGHLVPITGAPVNDSSTVAQPGSDINNSGRIAESVPDPHGEHQASYLGTFDSSTGLYDAAGLASPVLSGPIALEGINTVHHGAGLGINDSGLIVGTVKDQKGIDVFQTDGDRSRIFNLYAPPGGAGIARPDIPHQYGLIYNPNDNTYTLINAGSSSNVVNGVHDVSPGVNYFGTANGVAYTVLTDINNEGVAVGYYMDGSSLQHAFIFNTITHAFTYIPDLTYPGSQGPSTIATAINDDGIVVGYYGQAIALDSALEPFRHVMSFAYDSNSNQFLTTNFSVPGGNNLGLTGINNYGMVTGQFNNGDMLTASLNPVVNIDNGGTLYVATPSSDTIHFAGGTGQLVLADPTHFHGAITGFNGTAPDAAHSDVIQVAGYDFFNANFQGHFYAATGILTLQDSDSPAITLNLLNFSGNIVFASDGHGGTLILDPPSGAATIAAGQLLDITSADDTAVTFTDGHGTLQLDEPAHFTGTIAGLSGAGNVLDLDGFAAATTTAATGDGSYDGDTNTTTLTVTDASGNTTAALKLAGDLSAASWTITDDHHGGAELAAVPAPPLAPVIQASTSANEVLSGTSHADQFVFAASSGHDTILGFTSGMDHIDLSALGSIVNASNIDSFLASHVTSPSAGDTLITLDFNDTILLRNVASSSVHAGDFILHA